MFELGLGKNTGTPRFFFGLVRTTAQLSVPRYCGVSIFSNRKPLNLQNIDRLEVEVETA